MRPHPLSPPFFYRSALSQRERVGVRGALLLLLFASILPPLAHADPILPEEIILDMSGSMYAKTTASMRYLQARHALSRAIDDGRGTPISVRVFGARSRNDCRDTELILPFSDNHAPESLEPLMALEPNGMTPLELSLKRAAEDFAAKPGAILLITDGIESCGGDPCRYAATLKKLGLRVDTIGFGSGPKGEAALRCVSEATGGRYYGAFDESSFAGAVAQARLEVACRDCGRLEAFYETPTSDRPVMLYRLLAAGTRNPLTLYPMTNLRSAAPPGLYDLLLIPKDGGELMTRGIRVEPDTVARPRFPSNELGEILALYRTKTKRDLSVGYQAINRATGDIHPISLITGQVRDLPAGTWDLVLEHEGEKLTLPAVKVEPARRTRVYFKHVDAGKLRVSYVPLAGAAELPYVAVDRESGNPYPGALITNKDAELPEGTYDLTFEPQQRIQLRLENVRVKPGKTSKAKFARKDLGAVLLTCPRDGRFPAFPYTVLASGHPQPGPYVTNQPMLLPAGVYDIRVDYPDAPAKTLKSVRIKPGKTTAIDLP